MKPIIAACVVALMTSTAFAQVPCGSRKVVEKNLQEKYGEALIAFGNIKRCPVLQFSFNALL